MKKPSRPFPSARRAVTAGLALALAISCGTPALIAHAEDAEQGTITINQVTGNETTFTAYQIFTADLDKDGKATHIEWASDDVKDAVVGVIEEYSKADDDSEDEGSSPTVDYTIAQNAAEYIVRAVSSTEDSSNSTSAFRVLGGFGTDLAAAMKGITSSGTVKSGTASSFDEGFYLFLTDASTVSDNEVATSPIYAAMNKDKAVTVTEKASLPTIEKTVVDDDGTEDAQQADANVGQDLSYKLVGHMPDNIDSFAAYSYTITDTMTNLELSSLDDVTITVTGTVGDGDDTTTVTADITSQCSTSYADSVLTVKVDDLKDLTYTVTTGVQDDKDDDTAKSASITMPITIDKDSLVTVTYKAHLTTSAAVGETGNKNSVTVTYPVDPTQDPASATTGTSTATSINTYAYKIALTKVDKANQGTGLAGAKYTVTEDASGKYVQADGSLGDTAHEFVTDSDGNIGVSGIDAGSYTIKETTAPDGYELQDADIKVTITPTYENGAVKSVTATVSGGEGDAVDSNSDGLVESGTGVTAIDASIGTISVRATDDKMVTLPLTGMSGNTAIYVIGGTIVAISLVGIAKSRRDEDGAAEQK